MVRTNESSYVQFCRQIVSDAPEQAHLNLSARAAIEGIFALGTSVYRKGNLKICHQALRKLLPRVQQEFIYSQSNNNKSRAELLRFDGLPQVLISLSNSNFFDEVLFSEFNHLVTHGRYLHSRYFEDVHAHRLVALLWALKRIRCENNDVLQKIRDQIDSLESQINSKSALQLLWIESQGEGQQERLKKFLNTFLEKKALLNSYVYNPKNSFMLSQIFINLYPEVAQQVFRDDHICLKSAANCASEIKQNPFYSKYKDFLQILQYAYEVVRQKLDPTKREYLLITEHKTEDNSPKITHFHKNKIEFHNQFESNVRHNLEQIGLPFRLNQMIAIYEVDAIVQMQQDSLQKIIEINGYNHFVINSDKQPQQPKLIATNDMKQRHLALLGYKDIIGLNYYEFERYDYDHEKRVAYIKSLLKV